MTWDTGGCGVGSPEHDLILVPVASGYKTYPLTQLLGLSRRTLRAAQGMGHAPLHFLTQRGPLQDGQSPLDMRYDTRTIQILLAESLLGRTAYWDRRWDWLDLLRPGRSFGDTVRPLIYRKWLPGGRIERGTDGELVAGGQDLTSHIGRFVERGLSVGSTIILTGTAADDGTYTVTAVLNDYTVTTDSGGWANDETNVHWQFTRGHGIRDLYCLLESGPDFDQSESGSPYFPTGYREALRFVAHDPFWYGIEQTETWSVAALDALVFDTDGASQVRAWFSHSHGGAGYWFFGGNSVADSIEVTYWGTRFAKPVVTLTGPATNPVIENTTIGTRIVMDYGIAVGEVVTIDTLTAMVTNNTGANLMPYTTGDVATFGLSPSPQAPNRINVVYVSFAGGVSGQSGAVMSWKSRYVGLA